MPTPTTYTFTQEVDYTSVLQASIQSSSIAVSLASIGTVGSGSSMTVSINFNDVLSSDDQTTLNSIMAAYANTSPPPPIPSVVQVLGADTLTLCPFGSTMTLAASSLTNCDVVIPTTMVLRGGIIFAPNAALGDWITVSVIDKDNVTGQGGTSTAPTILGTYIYSWYILPGIENRLEDVSISQSLMAGLYMRISYTSINTSAAAAIINFISYVGTP
jgi:hypothetical protein